MSEGTVILASVGASKAEGTTIAKRLREELLDCDANTLADTIKIEREDPQSQNEGELVAMGIGLLCHLVGVGFGVAIESVHKLYKKPIVVRFPDGATVTFTGATDKFVEDVKRLAGMP